MSKQAELKDRLKYALDLREKKAVDLEKDLKIPRSAVSQYLSGNRTIKDSKRLFIIAQYLDVSEAWLMGFDVPMERTYQKKNDTLSDIIVHLRSNEDFYVLVETLHSMDADKMKAVRAMLSALLK